MKIKKVLLSSFLGFIMLVLAQDDKSTKDLDYSSFVDARAQCTLMVRPAQIPQGVITSTIVCSLIVKNVSPGMFTWQIYLNYDPSILHFIRVVEGDFLCQGGNPTLFMPDPFDSADNIRYPRHLDTEDIQTIYFGCTVNYGGHPVTGTGCLAIAEFQVVGIGKTTIGVDTLKWPFYGDPASFWCDGQGMLHYFRPVFNATYSP